MNLETKKTEKLVSAVYLLTSFFADLEPMKWRLRDLSSKLLGTKESKHIVQEIMSLLTVAKNAGLVSDMNYGIIHKEFSLLLPKESNLIEMFKRDESADSKVEAVRESHESSALVGKYLPAVSQIRDEFVKDKETRITQRPIQRDIVKNGVVAVKKNGRQSVILDLVKKKGEIMIKDVSPHIEGVSEKTIQRELLSMVSQGILVKEGEKRWSKYSLAN